MLREPKLSIRRVLPNSVRLKDYLSQIERRKDVLRFLESNAAKEIDNFLTSVYILPEAKTKDDSKHSVAPSGSSILPQRNSLNLGVSKVVDSSSVNDRTHYLPQSSLDLGDKRPVNETFSNVSSQPKIRSYGEDCNPTQNHSPLCISGHQVIPDSATNHSIVITNDKEPLKDIITRLIAQIIRSHTSNNSNYREMNCIALGYRVKTTNCAAELRSFMDIECYYLNTLHSFIQTTNWVILAERFGEPVIRHIFNQPAFIRCSNGCYIQVTGTPLPALLHSSKATDSNAETQTLKSTWGSLTIPKHFMFYGTGYSIREWYSLAKSFSSIDNPRLSSLQREEAARQLCNKIFQIEQLNLNDYDKIKVTNHLSNFMSNLAQPFNSMIIPEILEYYCPLRKGSETNTQPDIAEKNEDHGSHTNKPESTIFSPSTVPSSLSITSMQNIHRKRTRRGCRSGRRKQRDHSPSMASVFPLEITPISSSIKSKVSPIEDLTIGQELAGNLLTVVSNAGMNSGIVSQPSDSRELFSSPTIPRSPDCDIDAMLQSNHLSLQSHGSSEIVHLSCTQSLSMSKNLHSLDNILPTNEKYHDHHMLSTNQSYDDKLDPIHSLSSKIKSLNGTNHHHRRPFLHKVFP